MKKYFMFFVLALLLVSCGNSGDYERRISKYSTSVGFNQAKPEPMIDPSERSYPMNDLPEPTENVPSMDNNEEEDTTPPPNDLPPNDNALPDDGPSENSLPPNADPFADDVVSYRLGEGGGFQNEQLPDIVLGGPRGAGAFQGSFDVFSLGVGGEITLEMTDYLIFDGEGPDFIVFENAFQIMGSSEVTFAEPGIVSVSEDGIDFVEFPCDATETSVWPYEGCAGVTPALANTDLNEVDPTDPDVAGGDVFDLADVDLQVARFVRIRDSGLGLGPIGPETRGFDLDAVAVIHGTLPY